MLRNNCLSLQLGVRTFIGSIGPIENVRMMVSVVTLIRLIGQLS